MLTPLADGQTGSGKTFTMVGIQRSIADDLFYGLASRQEEGQEAAGETRVFVAFFEIYGGRCYDLMNNKTQLAILED